MSATDTLISQAVCIEQCIPKGMEMPVLISIFAKIAGMSTATDALIAGAVCIEQCVPKGMQLPVLISLANTIAAGGGTGGGGGTGPLFTSALLPLTATNYSVAHGLAGTPSFKAFVLVCVSNDANTGYVVGDETECETWGTTGAGGSAPFAVGGNATILFMNTFLIPVGNESNFAINNKNNGQTPSPSSFNNFRLKFYARL